MFLGENKNNHNSLNEFLTSVLKDIKRKGYGTLELKTEMGRPDITTFYELQFIYKPSTYNSDNMLHTELRQVNHDDDYSLEDLVRARIYDVERITKKEFNNFQIEKSKNSVYLHLANLEKA